MHRPRIDWAKAEQRLKRGTVEQRIFDGLKKMIAVRKEIAAFADFNNRDRIDLENPHLFAFWRNHPQRLNEAVLVVGNFDAAPQYLDTGDLGGHGMFQFGHIKDLCSGESPAMFKEQLVIPPHHFYCITDQLT